MINFWESEVWEQSEVWEPSEVWEFWRRESLESLRKRMGGESLKSLPKKEWDVNHSNHSEKEWVITNSLGALGVITKTSNHS